MDDYTEDADLLKYNLNDTGAFSCFYAGFAQIRS
jgi:hypothetical protein